MRQSRIITVTATLALAISLFYSPRTNAAELPDARLKRLEFDTDVGNSYSAFVYPPIPASWPDTTVEQMQLNDLGHWAANNLTDLSHRAGEPMLLLVRSPSITSKSRLWLESVTRDNGQLTVTLGRSGELIKNYQDLGRNPFLLLDIGPLEAGELEFQVRFEKYEIDPKAKRDERGRPIGRKLLDEDEDDVVPESKSIRRGKFTAADPAKIAAEKIAAAELKARVDSSAEILVVEKVDRAGVSAIQDLRSLKGVAWYRDKQVSRETFRSDLLLRPADQWRWIVFLPWDPVKRPPLPATGELTAQVITLISQPDEWAKISDDWEVGLRSKKTKFKVGGPIDIEFSSRNRSAETQPRYSLGFKKNPHYSYAKFEVFAPDGTRHLLSSLVGEIELRDKLARPQVGPGDCVIETIALDQWKPRGGGEGAANIFSKPGEYRVSCVLPADRAKKLAMHQRSYTDH